MEEKPIIRRSHLMQMLEVRDPTLFLSGACHIFAAVLNKTYLCPIYVLRDAKGGIVRAVVKCFGEFKDVDGCIDRQDFYDRFTGKFVGEPTPITREALLEYFENLFPDEDTLIVYRGETFNNAAIVFANQVLKERISLFTLSIWT